ncbi:biotin-dependent carboxyltransferase family protein [Staphylococcus gallinarum]|uniref:Biotin-dependent carboxyltransferase family protein n=1 Tax=Staphylococcus gallinarum TaxID=1293 RepID=A0A3A0VY06_STAGA|nr:biotin-dependent carboxyltransferase family protein [Staphylococcus gallinarum]RIP34178.1 biotin-dependent carboxyltransferase family protein [Staphylococcus gallinarum]
MSIKIIKPGLFSTVQDEGRVGYQDQGFSSAGALDKDAFRLGQALLNHDGPAIEYTVIGPTIEFLADNAIVMTGGCFNASLNSTIIDQNTVIDVKKGDVLAIGKVIKGARGYLNFANPIQVPKIADSYSTHTRSQMGGYQGRTLKKDDVIDTKKGADYATRIGLYSNPKEDIFDQQVIRIVKGPQIDAFSEDAINTLIASVYTISEQSDRMGYRLQGESIPPECTADIISEPVALGSIQVPNDGNPIILLNDKQTVGGYTKIATVCAMDLPILAQKQPGSEIQFEWITVEQASAQLREKEHEFLQELTNIEQKPMYDLKQLRRTALRIKNLLKGE